MACTDSCKCPPCWHTGWNWIKAHSENVLLALLVLFMGIGILIGLLLRGLDPPLDAQQVGADNF